MRAWTLGLALAAMAAGTACKAKSEFKDTPETLQAMDNLKQKLADEQKLRALLEEENSRLKLGATSTGDEVVVVRLEGDALSIVAGADKGPHQGEPKGTAKDEALYTQFVQSVKQSRGSIKKCYQNALKKNSGLQARTVPLAITVNFLASGVMSSATFNPRISDHFDKCMVAIAKGWKLPAAPRQVSFQYKMSLQPE